MNQLKAFVSEAFFLETEMLDKADEKQLQELGIGSFDLFHILQFLEINFGIKVHDNEFNDENFGSLQGICNYIVNVRREN
ncbi:acyl carrier protein [Paenibacillus piscarius]|uniref:acyl carrier protein n=1 Tax=Paenibacillus piscarius TaxID=1089681 RepID=UPI001EE7CC34|nr:acyl carrier protein [Paenibacillus piscarius]